MATGQTRRIRVMPPVYLLAAIVAMVVLHIFLSGGVLVPTPWRWLGLAPLIGGLFLGGSAATLFRKHQTTIKPGQTSSRLMVEGPFRFTRNPIYVGMILVLAGIALLLNSLTPWLILPVFAYLIASKVIPVEESMLEQTFGAEYREYQEKVRRWV
jgi:protein-S-isoprenylcysteine O-methyltransferase Ste14